MKKTVKEKRLKFKHNQKSRCDEDKEEFREASKEGSSKAKESAYKDLFDKLDLIGGQNIIKRERRTSDLTDIAYIKDIDGTILTDEDEIKARWN